jgi:hypothetical protein
MVGPELKDSFRLRTVIFQKLFESYNLWDLLKNTRFYNLINIYKPRKGFAKVTLFFLPFGIFNKKVIDN